MSRFKDLDTGDSVLLNLPANNNGTFYLGAVNSFTPGTTFVSTTSQTQVMAGYGADATQPVVYTPQFTGKLRVLIVVGVGQLTAGANTTLSGQYGTGTAPAAAAAVTGTVFPQGTFNIRVPSVVTGTATNAQATISAVLSGLTIGTKYWFDIALSTQTSADQSQINWQYGTIEEIN